MSDDETRDDTGSPSTEPQSTESQSPESQSIESQPTEMAAVPPPGPATVHAGDARMWASFCHLAGLVFLISVPGVIGSLVIWLWKRADDPFIDEQGKEAVNFQLTVLIAQLVTVVVAFVTCTVGAWILVPLVFLASAVLPALAAVATSDGKSYRYPWTLRLIE